MIEFTNPAGYYLFALLVSVIAVGRATRLVSQDTFPPAAAFRDFWRRLTRDGPWSELITCPFCVAPYLAAASLAWAAFSNLHAAWWVVHLWAAVAYLASILVAQDT